MKIFAGLLILILAMTGSFYYGQKVASDNVWTSCEALQASHSVSVVTAKFPEDITVDDYSGWVKSEHKATIVDGFIGLGRFESELTSKFPFLVGDSEFAMRLLKTTLSKYPEINELKMEKRYPEKDKSDKFMNDQVDWFYRGLKSVTRASHNKAI